MTLKVLSVFGTRPEAIKLAPVLLQLAKHPGQVESRVCVTAQHREMLDQVLQVFGIAPELDLDLMQPNQSLADLTARAVSSIAKAIESERPDIVLVQGDTTSVMAGALAAFYHRVPVGHVEAGLRTSDRYSPFPEEVNRRVTGVLTTYHFAPTDTARQALLREGVSAPSIWVTGNTVIDALRMIAQRPMSPLARHLLQQAGAMPASGEAPRDLVLVTAHRRENFGRPLEQICQGLKSLAERNPTIHIVYPVHQNPNVREPVRRILSGVDRILVTDPVDYVTMVHLMSASRIVLTDSGGIQEEAPALGKPVLVLRTETERPEAVEAGTARLIGPYADAIVTETERLLRNPTDYQRMARAVSPYGDGHAAERIVDVLLEHRK